MDLYHETYKTCYTSLCDALFVILHYRTLSQQPAELRGVWNGNQKHCKTWDIPSHANLSGATKLNCRANVTGASETHSTKKGLTVIMPGLSRHSHWRDRRDQSRHRLRVPRVACTSGWLVPQASCRASTIGTTRGLLRQSLLWPRMGCFSRANGATEPTIAPSARVTGVGIGTMGSDPI